jgi:sugar O-acyltransferase (sialic acid O-acetyltransferase NeuD family)
LLIHPVSVSGPSKIVIVGAGEFAEIAYEYLTHDSPYEVVGFSIGRDFLDRTELCGLPVVPFDELEAHFDPGQHGAIVAVTYAHLNRVRTRLYEETKTKGFHLCSYVSSDAFVWRDVEIGENSFIFEHNVLQYGVKIGKNVVLWSGNHIGHQTRIHDNCFVSSHVVISGYCEIGANCFLGVNSTFADNLIIAKDTVVGAGAVVVRNTEAGKVYKGNPAVGSELKNAELLRPVVPSS